MSRSLSLTAVPLFSTNALFALRVSASLGAPTTLSATRSLARSARTMALQAPGRGSDADAAGSALDTAHSAPVRRYLRTYGLVPPAVEPYATQAARCLRQLAAKTSPIEKYQYLSALRRANVHLFYRLAVDHGPALTPLIYTPVVGEACRRWHELYLHPEGLYVSYADKGHIAAVLRNWTQPKVAITVITDGSRILGLGDLGVNGMGIPVGKLSLYCACGGLRPDQALPITVDLGTGNQALRDDPLYMGSRRPRVSPAEEQEFLDELMEALVARWPGIVIQFEDFKNPFPSLERYAPRYAMFNDDIQGTGAVVLAGIINAVRATGVPPRDQRCVVMGAGSAAVGVAKQIVAWFMETGLTEDEARACFYLVDTKGLVTNDRGDKLAPHKTYFSRADNAGRQCKTLAETVKHVRPTILLGLCTQGGVFDATILRQMGAWNARPIVFPLSNPSANSECTFADAVAHTDGRVLFASGSPFDAVEHAGRTLHPGQGNNMYIFPALGLAAVLAKATAVTQGMVYASATALAASRTPAEEKEGRLYPDLARIRDVSARVAVGVIRAAQAEGVDREPRLRELGDDDELERWVRGRMYEPHAEAANVEREVVAELRELGVGNGANGHGVNGHGANGNGVNGNGAATNGKGSHL